MNKFFVRVHGISFINGDNKHDSTVLKLYKDSTYVLKELIVGCRGLLIVFK
jgi:hypothetical protein